MMSETYPVLPLRDIVIFPGMTAPLFLGRAKSILAAEDALRRDAPILLLAQIDAEEAPSNDRFYTIGTIATVRQHVKLPGGPMKLLVTGTQRARVSSLSGEADFLTADAEPLGEVFQLPVDLAVFGAGTPLSMTVAVSDLQQILADDMLSDKERLNRARSLLKPAQRN